jgi:RNA polymerase sigma-70 factor (family 1)
MKKGTFLINNIRDGDVNAFREIYESFYPSLLFVAAKYLKDKDASSDIVQDAFLYFWSRKAEVFTIDMAKTYLYKYVKHRSLNYLRDRNGKSSVKLTDEEDNTLFRDLIIEEETYLVLYRAIQSLSPQSQKVIELSLDGLKNQEIAIILNISINTVKTIKLRAYKALREDLKDIHFALFFILCSQDNEISI